MKFKVLTDLIIDKEIDRIGKLDAYNGRDFPLSEMDSRKFEIMIYQIVKRRIDAEDKEFGKKFDNVFLMQGVGEKGRDIVLMKNENVSGIIQCKQSRSNILKKDLVDELIKLCLHRHLDNSLFEPEKLNYYLATTHGFAGNLVDLVASYKRNLLKETKLKEWTRALIKDTVAFNGIKYEDVEGELISSLKEITVSLIYPEQISRWLNNDLDISKAHFEIRTVVDNTIITNLIKQLTVNEKEDIDKFLLAYREAALESLGKINFFGIDLKNLDRPTEEVELSKLYVRPNFSIRMNKRFVDADPINKVAEKTLTVGEMFNYEKSYVILGDPGAGKSLFVKYTFVSLLQKSDKEYENFYDFIPFRIELRKFVNYKKDKTFIEFLQTILNVEYDVNISLKTLKTIIDQKNTIFFFDGLDEIFDFNKKNEIKKAIELFTKKYLNAKCIVTSRFIGYHDLKFDTERFYEFEILDLAKPQINELVTNFFTTQIGNETKRVELINSCIKQLEDVDSELKSNPLILTLIILLVKNQVSIPDSKLQIYECCTDTLLNRDELENRGEIIKLREKDKKNQRRILGSLAFWQYNSISTGEIITRHKAKKQIADYLIEKKEYEDIDSALLAAEDFLEVAEKRSIYFDNDFTHKTFLEYYTSDFIYKKYIVRNNEKERNELIAKYASYPFWYVVFELLFARIDNNVEDEEVLDGLIQYQIRKANSPELFFLLLNSFRKLRFVSSSTIERSIKDSLKICIEGKDIKGNGKSYRKEDTIFYSLGNLILNENKLHIFRLVLNDLEANIDSELALIKLYKAYYELGIYFSRNNTGQNFNVDISNKVKLEELSKKDELLFSHFNITNRSGINFIQLFKSQIEMFDKGSIFKKHQFEFIKDTIRVSTFETFLSRTLGKISYSNFEEQILALMKCGIEQDLLLKELDKIRMYSLSVNSTFSSLINYYKMSQNKVIDSFIEIVIKNHSILARIDYSRIKDDFSDNHKFKKLEKILNFVN